MKAVQLLLIALLLPAVSYAQTGRIAGTVTEAGTNEPIPGVNVFIDGTQKGAATGVDGSFTITGLEPGSYDVRATFIGYTSALIEDVTVEAGETTPLDITMRASSLGLDEVVVVGYGTQQRSDVTGAVTSLSPQRIEEVPNTNFAQALQGAVPGVTIRTDAAGAEQNNLTMIVRGRSSIKASNKPLIVVDGIPYDGSISEINQHDIASIEVLKDASAAAIYGSRGSNGVILITTKKGSSGKPRVSYDGYVGVQSIAHVPDLMNGEEFAAFKCQRLNGGEDCESALTPTELENFQNGVSTDWVDVATRQGFQQQHSLSFTGGTDNTRYYISGSVLDVEGIAKGDDFQRYTLRVNLDQDVSDWFRMGTSTQLSSTDRGGLSASFGDAFYMNPLTTPFEEDGSQKIYPWPEDPFFDNPLAELLARHDDLSRRVLSNSYLEVDLPFVDGLSYRLNGGIDYVARDVGRYYGRDMASGLERQGYALVDNDNQYDWTLENIVRYDKAFGGHAIGVTALYSAQESSFESHALRSEGFPNDVLTYYQPHVASALTPSTSFARWSLVSQMGRVNYSYDGRYLLTATVRRDGYSGFGANHKYGTFPSLALGWNVAQEDFWPLEVVNALKLRASYGQNGNQGISPYETLARLEEQSYLDGEATAPGFIPSKLANPDLKWEETTEFNLGFDFGIFEDRIQGSIDVYRARTTDLLLDRSISPVHGITEITENIGEVLNRGIELQIASVNIDTEDFTWETNFNFSANRNEIVDLYGDQEDDVANEWFIGKPIAVNYGYQFEGIWQEGDDIENSAQPDAQPGDVRVADLDGDGQITPEDRTIIGHRLPRYLAGMTNTLRYKDFTLAVFAHTVQGLTRSNPLLSGNVVFADVRRNTVNLDWWTPENRSNRLPANRPDANPHSAGYHQDASFIRLKDVTLSYSVPTQLSNRVGVESLSVYVSGRNLWTITDWTGLDPELSSQRAIPLNRTITGGIRLSL